MDITDLEIDFVKLRGYYLIERLGTSQIMERNSEALGLTPNLSFRLRF